MKRLSIQDVEQIIHGPCPVTTISEMTIQEVLLYNAKVTAPKSFIENPFSEDASKEWSNLNSDFMAKVVASNYVVIIATMIPKRSKWGKVTYSILLIHSGHPLHRAIQVF